MDALKRLFAQAKANDFEAAIAHNMLVDIFDTHGEALVEALERIHNISRGKSTVCDPFGDLIRIAETVEPLLAKLEQKAGG